MLDILKFIFSSFWVWAGTVMLVYVIGEAILNAIKMILLKSIINKRGKKDIEK